LDPDGRLARADVKKAMHTDVSPNPVWPGPGEKWGYTSNWGACSSMPAGTPSMVDFYRYIAPKLKRTVVFNGDTDPCVSYEVGATLNYDIAFLMCGLLCVGMRRFA
jgi:cathepsin A (carboxypeptidase C)